MIKPYYKEESNYNVVEVEDYGVINLSDLPIITDKEGLYEIVWSQIDKDGSTDYVLSHVGGSNPISYAGRMLGVIREIS